MNTVQQINLLPLRLTFNQACQLLNLSREGLRLLSKRDNSFPKPMKMGNSQRAAVYFDRQELCTWYEDQKVKN
jgi:predicted DNA-binding transcriptional regulator AlpA